MAMRFPRHAVSYDIAIYTKFLKRIIDISRLFLYYNIFEYSRVCRDNDNVK